MSRNCTEFGWSETFPHYIDACLYEEGNSSHVVSAAAYGDGWRSLRLSDVLLLRRKKPLIFTFLCVASASISGYVLRVGQGSLHCGLQHLPGLSHHGHGHPLQVQVRPSSLMDTLVEILRSGFHLLGSVSDCVNSAVTHIQLPQSVVFVCICAPQIPEK